LEFKEELGIEPPGSEWMELGTVKQKGGKTVHAWAFEGDCDPASLSCNTFLVQWPPKSGQWKSFPEVDAYGFFDLETAREKLNPAQVTFLDRLRTALEPAE
jgi:predicted NUDIX family NTP pyrophosphohydrolase